VIQYSDTVIYPRAMVVKSLNTSITNCTMFRPWCS